jgi:hypothetical protein
MSYFVKENLNDGELIKDNIVVQVNSKKGLPPIIGIFLF